MKNNFLFALLLLINLSFAQNKYDFKQFVNEGGDYFTAPLEWKGKDLLFFGVAAGLTISAMQFDDNMQEFTQYNRNGNSSIPIIAGRLYGEPIFPVLLSSYLIIQGNSTGNSVNKKIGFEIAQAVFYSGATTQIIKMLFGRERPSLTSDPTNYTGFTLFDNNFWSLPSGHTTTAFAVSTVLFENADSDFLKVLSLAPAFLTAYSRIYENRHWLSDVVLGGIIGFTAAKFFVQKHQDSDHFNNAQPTELFSITLPIN